MINRVAELQKALITYITGCGDEAKLEALLAQFKSPAMPSSKEAYVAKILEAKQSIDSGLFKTHEEIEGKFRKRLG